MGKTIQDFWEIIKVYLTSEWFLNGYAINLGENNILNIWLQSANPASNFDAPRLC
jgi:hypothetical protein